MLSFKLETENETRNPILKNVCDHWGLFLFPRSLAHQDLLLLTLSGTRPGSQLAVLDFLHSGLFADLCTLFCAREVALWWTLPNLHPKTWLAAGSFPFSRSRGQLDTSLLLPDYGRWFAQRVTKSCRAMLPRVYSLLGQLLIIVHDRSDSLSLPRSFFQLGSLLLVLRAWPARVLVLGSHAQLH